MDILQRITDIRKSKGLSIYELANKSGIAKNTIYRWYSKSYKPTLDTLQIIVEKGLGISLVEFFAIDTKLIPVNDEIKELVNLWTNLNDTQKQIIKQLLLSYQKWNI